MEATATELISALGGLLAAIGGLYAARAAASSAKAASDATKLAAHSENRSIRRELAFSSGEVLSEAQLVKAFVQDLKIEYTTLFVFGGQSGSSTEKLLNEKLDNRLTSVQPLENEAIRLVNEFKRLKDASDEDITEALLRIENMVLQVRNYRLELERELSTVAQQNRDYRERALNR